MQSMFVFIYVYWFDLISSSIAYFTCTATGVFPDTAQCGIEKYFYCQQGVGGKCWKKDFTKKSDIWYILLF
jgi:hypothetical protein